MIALLGDSAWVLLAGAGAGLVRNIAAPYGSAPRSGPAELMIALGGGLAATSASHNSAP